MIQNNRHKSINSKLCELVEQNSNEDEKNDNLKRVKIIAQNRTKEVHVSSKEKPEVVFSWPILNEIQTNYAKEQYKKSNSKS